MADKSYRWGKFQGWAALGLAVVQLLFMWRTFPVNLITAVLLLYVWTGLLHKHRYGFVFIYVMAGVAFLGGLAGLVFEERWDLVGSMALAFCFWAIPGAFYYPKRYREFGFGRGKESVTTTVESPKTAAVEATQAAVVSNSAEDAGIRKVGEEEWREAVARYRVKVMENEKKKPT
jgi:hypothetical protein